MKNTKKTVKEIIDGAKCPLPLETIPNSMGINLVSVDSVEWKEFDNGQLVSLTINFTPNKQLKQ